MKKLDDADMQRGSGLFIGSEPINGLNDRHASGKDGDSKEGGLLGDKGDDDSTDTDSTDSDSDGSDSDSGDDSTDSDGKD